MAVKQFFSVLITSLLLFTFAGCMQFEEAVETQLGTKVDLQNIKTETDIHIRDKDLLYTQNDNSEIVKIVKK